MRSLIIKRIRMLIPAVALVWASVILAASSKLNRTSYESKILITLAGGAAVVIILLGGGLRRLTE